MNIAALAEDLGLEEEDARRLVLSFLDITEQDLLLLNQALDEQDADTLSRTAHHIKGAARNLELEVIAEAALAIEEGGRSANFADAAHQITLIHSELDSMRAEIASGE